jgi:hypothetical protein
MIAHRGSGDQEFADFHGMGAFPSGQACDGYPPPVLDLLIRLDSSIQDRQFLNWSDQDDWYFATKPGEKCELTTPLRLKRTSI